MLLNMIKDQKSSARIHPQYTQQNNSNGNSNGSGSNLDNNQLIKSQYQQQHQHSLSYRQQHKITTNKKLCKFTQYTTFKYGLIIILILLGIDLIIRLIKYFLYMQTYQLINLSTTSALCLDGSPANYYLSYKGDIEYIYLHFEHGGWCGADTEDNTIKNCYQRSQGPVGSSRFYSNQNKQKQGILSRQPDNNFRNWKKVIIKYCDGSGHQGYRENPVQYLGNKVYFRGHNITMERLDDLQKRIGLFSKSKFIIVGGFSAGSVAALQWANYISQKTINAEVRALADSPIFYDSINVNTNQPSFKKSIINLLKFSNPTTDPPVPDCIARYPSNKQNCMFAQNFYQDIKVPIFIMQSLYDSWMLPNILGLQESPTNPKSSQCLTYKPNLDQFRTNVKNVLKQIGKNSSNGVFAISCYRHGIATQQSYYSASYKVPQNSQFTAKRSVEMWLQDKKLNNLNNVHIDEQQWPNNVQCAYFNS